MRQYIQVIMEDGTYIGTSREGKLSDVIRCIILTETNVYTASYIKRMRICSNKTVKEELSIMSDR